MKSFLEFKREDTLDSFRDQSRWLDLLTAHGAEQEIIQEWCRKYTAKRDVLDRLVDGLNARRPETVLPCERWEAALYQIAGWFGEFRELSSWEAAPSEQRSAKAEKIAKLARELADELEESPRVDFISEMSLSTVMGINPNLSSDNLPVLALFDDERAVDIIRSMPEPTAVELLDGTGYSVDRKTGYDPTEHFTSPAAILAAHFCYPEPQELPSILRRLADYAAKSTDRPRRNHRPNAGNANARVFAKYLATNFRIMFRRKPDDVIAACVALRYPDPDNPPNGDTIRSWRGAR
jgi:hypothetical protein